MDIGFLTACMKAGLEDTLEWAQNNGFENVEIGGQHAAFFRADYVEDIAEMLGEYNIRVSAIGKFSNWIDAPKEKRMENYKELYDLIDCAAGLKVPNITTFVGLNNQMDYEGNLELFKQEWVPIVEYAADKKINIAIENCPMKRAYGLFGGNIMISPGIWNDLFELTPPNFGLNFDPSHLYWQDIDPALPVEEFIDRIFHVHMKDCALNKMIRDFVGVFGNGTYRYPLPGLGEIDFIPILSILKEEGYKGALSIEHEDGNYLGNDEKAQEGLLLAKKNIENWLKEI